ncbi:MAG: hypothetical protein WCI95_03120 [bacterium]
MNTKKLGIIGLLLISIIAIASIVQAATVTEPTTFRDRVVFRGSTGPDFDADNSFSIGQVKVTATAAQLNAAGSGTVTNGTLNPLIVSNANLQVTASNVVVGATLTIVEGALTDSTVVTGDIKDGTIVNADLSATAAVAHSKVATNTIGACVITNISTLSTNILWFDAQGMLTNKTVNP